MPPHERTTPVIERLKERVERVGWEPSPGSLPVVYVNDVIDWLDELEALLRLGAAQNVTGSAEPAGDAGAAAWAESTAASTKFRRHRQCDKCGAFLQCACRVCQ